MRSRDEWRRARRAFHQPLGEAIALVRRDGLADYLFGVLAQIELGLELLERRQLRAGSGGYPQPGDHRDPAITSHLLARDDGVSRRAAPHDQP